MVLNASSVLLIIALLFAVGSLIPWGHSHYLLGVAVILIAIASLIPAMAG